MLLCSMGLEIERTLYCINLYTEKKVFILKYPVLTVSAVLFIVHTEVVCFIATGTD